jgi:hypothetical protein
MSLALILFYAYIGNYNILEKLGLARRSEAAAFAVEHKLVPPGEQHKDEEF